MPHALHDSASASCANAGRNADVLRRYLKNTFEEKATEGAKNSVDGKTENL